MSHTGSAPALSMVSVSKSYGPSRVLDSLTLDLAAGEILALLGQNGSGKSTLIKVLSGYHLPDSGSTVTVNGEPLKFGSAAASHSAGLRFVHQELGLIGDQTVADNMAFSTGYPTKGGRIQTRLMRARAQRALAKVGIEIDPERTVASLTPAQRTAVAIARALGAEEDEPAVALILDEPTATLPVEEVQVLLEVLRASAKSGAAIMLVTHHLEEALEVSDRLAVIRDGRLIAASPRADFTQNNLVEFLTGTPLAARTAMRNAVASANQDPTLIVRGLAGTSVADVSFDARAGEIVGVYGLTGSGRETLLGAVFGARPRSDGEVVAGSQPLAPEDPRAAMKAGIGYVPSDRKASGSFQLLEARENFGILKLPSYSRFGLLSRKREVQESEDWFGRLDVRPSGALEMPLALFSGGNQQKIVICKWLSVRPKILLLDDPTQGVDIAAKADIHAELLAAARDGVTIVMSSNDEEELSALCSRVLILANGRIALELTAGDEGISSHELTEALHRVSADSESGAER